ncbi:MAG: NUDIX domain-containing protein, partial [Leuconostoc citreum]|nr:NUDIX domain-containing protein [Leuconostoc citreum]
MDRTIPIELTNMIMIENPKTKEILVEDRKNPAWPGVTFPGGHIENGETIVASVIR